VYFGEFWQAGKHSGLHGGRRFNGVGQRQVLSFHFGVAAVPKNQTSVSRKLFHLPLYTKYTFKTLEMPTP